MSLADLINRLRPEEYWAKGTYYLADRPSEPRPLIVSCTLFSDGAKSLLIEGTYRHHAHATSHPFSLRIPLDSPTPLCELNCSHTGAIAGRLHSAGGCNVLLMTGPKSAFSAQFEVSPSGSIHVTGAVNAGEHCFLFTASGDVGPERETLGNVVAIGARRG